MITVLPSKSTIFLSSLVNIYFLPQKKINRYPLGKEVINFLSNNIDKELSEKLKNDYKDFNPLMLHYHLCILSILLDDNLEIIEEKLKVFGRNTVINKHIIIINSTIKDIYKQVDFATYYKKFILSKYKDLCVEIERMFDLYPNVYQLLLDFWRISTTFECIFIPNFVSIGDCFSSTIDKTIYSLTSPKVRNNFQEYYPKHVISNTIHELSHSFFKELVKEEKKTNWLNEKYQELFNRIDIKEYPRKVNGTGYFEENLIKASTIFLKEEIGLSTNSIKEIEDSYSLGYELVPTIYNKLKGKKGSVLNIFLEILEDI